MRGVSRVAYSCIEGNAKEESPVSEGRCTIENRIVAFYSGSEGTGNLEGETNGL